MVHALESVTLAVRHLETAVDLFRDQFGLTVVRDTRASVGLLSAWHHPVHESVRLIELAKDSQPAGRVRLAYYEDRWTGSAPHAAPDGALGREQMSSGPALLEFRGSGEMPLNVAASGPIHRLEALAPGAVLGEPSGGLNAVWIAAPDWEGAGRFYTEVLGYVCHERTELTAEAARDLFKAIAHGRPSLRAAAFFAPGAHLGGVVLLDAAGAGPAGAPARGDPGRPGIRFLTCRCDDLDGVLDRLHGLGIDPLTPPSHVGLPNGKPARVMLIRAPGEELYELVEPED
jgi:catechol 2,3-dioxygenase-like lactoylglutathione lyase family enzyme